MYELFLGILSGAVLAIYAGLAILQGEEKPKTDEE